MGGQPRSCRSDWKDQLRWNRDCRRYLSGMNRTSTFRICVAGMRLQNNLTLETILCQDFPRQWPSASAQSVSRSDFPKPRFIRQEMQSHCLRLQRGAPTPPDAPADSASSAATFCRTGFSPLPLRRADKRRDVFIVSQANYNLRLPVYATKQ